MEPQRSPEERMHESPLMMPAAQHTRSLALRIAVAVAASVALARLLSLQELAAATAAVMLTQPESRITLKSASTRLLGVVIGGLCGMAVAAVDNGLHDPVLFVLLVFAGAWATLALCALARLPDIAGRVSCITFVLVALVAQGQERYLYAWHRLTGTLLGAVVSLAVSWLWVRAAGGGSKR